MHIEVPPSGLSVSHRHFIHVWREHPGHLVLWYWCQRRYIRRTLTTEYTFIRYEPVMWSHISGERHDGPLGMSGNRSVSIGQHSVYGHEASQHNETSVERRLGENHGGVERPMDPVSCRTSDDFPVFPGLSGTNTERSY